MEHAKIGPNSIIRTVEALQESYGSPQAQAMLQQGGLPDLADNLPSSMVAEEEFLRLIAVLLSQVGSEQTKRLLRRSGQLTAFYLLQHRIPHAFQKLLKVLPPGVALTLLLVAISKSAWTFVGSGAFSFTGGAKAVIVIANRTPNPMIPTEICSFYAGTFEQIFQVLIDPQTTVQKAEQAPRDIRCAYHIHYGAK